MDIYSTIPSLIICFGLLLAFSKKFADLGRLIIGAVFVFDIFYMLSDNTNSIRLVMDILIVCYSLTDLVTKTHKKWSNKKMAIGVILTGILLVFTGLGLFISTKQPIFLITGLILIIKGVFVLWQEIINHNPRASQGRQKQKRNHKL